MEVEDIAPPWAQSKLAPIAEPFPVDKGANTHQQDPLITILQLVPGQKISLTKAWPLSIGGRLLVLNGVHELLEFPEVCDWTETAEVWCLFRGGRVGKSVKLNRGGNLGHDLALLCWVIGEIETHLYWRSLPINLRNSKKHSTSSWVKRECHSL